MRLNKRLRKLSAITADIIFLLLALGIFIYSGYKIAENLKIFPANVFGVESCSNCSSCEGDNWLSDLCKTIRDWCKNSCPCHPTATPPPPVPTPTSVEPTPTSGQPSPTPTPTTAVQTPTPTGEVPTSTPTPTSGPPGVGGESGGGGGGGGGGPASPCVPPEAPKTPVLISAEIISSTEVKLTWTKVDRADHYAVAYGTASRNYTYGNSDVGNVDSYVVGNLVFGKTYFFVVSAAIGGDCPVASPYSNEVSSTRGQRGVLGARNDLLDPKETAGGKEEGDLGGGVSTQAGEVAGAKVKGACPFWWIVLLGQTLLLGGVYALLLKKKQLPKRWWLVVPSSVIFAYLVDRYAHTHWYIPSRMCSWEPALGAVFSLVETAGFKSLRKPRQKK